MKNFITYFFLTIALTNCTGKLPKAKSVSYMPAIFPDYSDVTVPPNIAPLNFKLKSPAKAIAVFSIKCNTNATKSESLQIFSKNGTFNIPLSDWHKLLKTAAAFPENNKINVDIYVLRNATWEKSFFSFNVAQETIDDYLVYRRIPPAYRMWSEMGIYQRNLTNFDETTILSNKLTNNNCMNCHSFCMQNPNRMLLHQRSTHAGTYFIIDGKIEKLNTKTENTISALVYPSWHPSGRFVAFSTNDIKQDYHFSDPNKIEVFDNESDVVVYDVENHEIITSAMISSKENFETFPTFSPDGKHLYFCSVPAQPMPESYREIKYNLLRVSFDPDKCTFGEATDTLFNANETNRSASFPRISPDGKHLLYTVSCYGNFSIWHKDADLQMLNLDNREINFLNNINSEDVESYHSWSGNSRWIVFSSRRDNGLYTFPYICYVNKEGNPSKPFILPQRNTDYYEQTLMSFNIPELVKGKIEVDKYKLIQISKYGESKDVSFSQKKVKKK